MIGKIKTKTEKQFGFIAVEGQEKDIFFHESALNGMTYAEISVDDMVEFDIEDSVKGPRAANVRRA